MFLEIWTDQVHKKQLEVLYRDLGKSSWEIAEIIDCSQTTVLKLLKLNNIPRRSYKENHNPNKGKHLSESHKQKISESNKGISKFNPLTGKAFNFRQIELICAQCGHKIFRQPRFIKQKNVFCNKKCHNNFLQSLEGDKHPHFTKLTVKCENCSKEFTRKKAQIENRKHHFCCRKCDGEWRTKNLTGDKIYNYKGGYDKWEDYGPSWPYARQQALERDNHTCQECGITAEELGKEPDVHHIIPFRFFGIERHEKANRLPNLKSLCPRDHPKEEVKNLANIEHAACCVKGIHLNAQIPL